MDYRLASPEFTRRILARREEATVLHIGAEPVRGFVIRSRLGAGAFGEVWEARDPKGNVVALKFIDSRMKDSFLLRGEIRILRALSEAGHPNLIRLTGIYASSHYLVLCMERADGNLDELRQTYRAVSGCDIPPEHLLQLLYQAAEALDFIAKIRLPGFNLASSGLQHCDVKPTNLLMMGDELKVADFGLCAAMGEQTHKNGWRGTPPYAAPELFRGRAAPTTDQYALAVTYCDLVAGERILGKVAHGNDPATLEVDFAKVRCNERPVLERAMAADPLRRWPSCRSFIEALQEAALAPRKGNSSDRVRTVRPGLARPSAVRT